VNGHEVDVVHMLQLMERQQSTKFPTGEDRALFVVVGKPPYRDVTGQFVSSEQAEVKTIEVDAKRIFGVPKGMFDARSQLRDVVSFLKAERQIVRDSLFNNRDTEDEFRLVAGRLSDRVNDAISLIERVLTREALPGS